MSHGLAKTYGVSTDVGRQEKVGSAGCLGASLQDAPVDGAHLVGMVAEVGGRTGIIWQASPTKQSCRLAPLVMLAPWSMIVFSAMTPVPI